MTQAAALQILHLPRARRAGVGGAGRARWGTAAASGSPARTFCPGARDSSDASRESASPRPRPIQLNCSLWKSFLVAAFWWKPDQNDRLVVRSLPGMRCGVLSKRPQRSRHPSSMGLPREDLTCRSPLLSLLEGSCTHARKPSPSAKPCAACMEHFCPKCCPALQELFSAKRHASHCFVGQGRYLFQGHSHLNPRPDEICYVLRTRSWHTLHFEGLGSASPSPSGIPGSSSARRGRHKQELAAPVACKAPLAVARKLRGGFATRGVPNGQSFPMRLNGAGRTLKVTGRKLNAPESRTLGKSRAQALQMIYSQTTQFFNSAYIDVRRR